MTVYDSSQEGGREEDVIDDVYDSPVYQNLKNKVLEHDDRGIPIYLQICWDGATMFHFVQGPSMWPLCYSIMNLPPSMRNKIHIGLHVASFCHGIAASQTMLAEELLDLWNNPIVVDDDRYYVVVSQILMDGPGRTKYTKCRSTTSFQGCNICCLPARGFGLGRSVYDGIRRYLPMDSTGRKKKEYILRHDGTRLKVSGLTSS